ncbi:GPCR kinase [Trema orientale]|uniref:GPCR kinase n=1 Tax=Trema orientale TaxID=63057 RepID=A0A2P5FGB9_TREOI|nr:GPCR kinase [Trema orientale]
MPLRFLILIFFFHFHNCIAQTNQCSPSSCGKIHNIRHPFRLKSDPKNCGDKRYVLSCENNLTILYLFSGRYQVEAIHYNNQTIRVVDPGVQKGNCSSLPLFSLSGYNFSTYGSYMLHQWNQEGTQYVVLSKTVIFMSCEKPVKSHVYIDAGSCSNGGSGGTLSQPKRHSYVLVNGSLSVSDMVDSCGVEVMALVPELGKNDSNASSFMDIHDELANGFELSWSPGTTPLPIQLGLWERIWDSIRTYRFLVLFIIGAVIVGRTILGTPCVYIFLIYKWRRRHLSMYDRIEEFLQSYNNLIPIRYSYSDIKKMTRGFRDKLGEGGYGSVYKGKLRSGHLVAVKILGTSKGNGQDFINEVATIGRIHHVNVVRLIGFCVEGSKRALVYDFMTNGSLDTHIFSKEGIDSLSCKKMFEISLGVARGIEYLHRGCEMQILHFDIKPHNILLDENFVPKVSDFGLARLCPLDDNIVSLTAARGTLGYIAPELFYKNIGGVSYKADVYSFGMLLMEMASRRKNVNSAAENSSQVHFPSWVSNQFSEGLDIDLGVETEEASKIIKKMMIVALWCIQFKPLDRPSMSKVVEMLEENSVSIEMPPTKFSFYLQEELVEDLGEYSSSSAWSSTQSGNSYSDTSLCQNAT